MNSTFLHWVPVIFLCMKYTCEGYYVFFLQTLFLFLWFDNLQILYIESFSGEIKYSWARITYSIKETEISHKLNIWGEQLQLCHLLATYCQMLYAIYKRYTFI